MFAEALLDELYEVCVEGFDACDVFGALGSVGLYVVAGSHGGILARLTSIQARYTFGVSIKNAGRRDTAWNPDPPTRPHPQRGTHMLRTITYTLLGLGAAAVISAPIASADLTNSEVAGGSEQSAEPSKPAPIIITTTAGSGGGQAYWAVVRDPNGKPYTDANGAVLKRCVSHCGDDYGKVEAKTGCGNVGFAVNEVPKPKPPTADPADSAE